MQKKTLSVVLFSFLLLSAEGIAQSGSLQGSSAGSQFRKSRINPAAYAGQWRGEFHVKDSLDIPFIFEIAGSKGQETKLYFINAEERFYGGTLKSGDNDSLHVLLDQFDNELVFAPSDNALHGYLRKQDGSGAALPVKAVKGNQPRFAITGVQPTAAISGTYDIIFKNERGKDEKAVGMFTQNGHQLKATFLRITGDSRYLDGIVSGNEFYLSTFIGSGPGYYKGTINADGSITGGIVGARGTQVFTGIPNEAAALPDAYALTLLKEGYSSLDFTFPDVNGKPVSLKDPQFKNKAVIVTITGSWCPNCIDEAAFLAPWYKKNSKRGVAIISLHYERKTDTAYARKVITRFKERFGIEYDQLFAGIADKQRVAESLPALNTFLSFPTTIFIDRQGKVSKIHTGFSGPATGKYYDEFIKEFTTEVDALLK